MKQTPLLLIGLGAHAKRIYYKIAKRDGPSLGFHIAYIVDVIDKKRDIELFLAAQHDKTPVLYASTAHSSNGHLSREYIDQLRRVIRERNIRGAIIATDPASHLVYARWALSEGLSVLMDKPVSIRDNASTDPSIPPKLLRDYQGLVRMYDKARRADPHILFSLMAQRRFHPAFQKIKSLIQEVHSQTNCPITSIQSFHGDGQWRLPHELTDMAYHGYTRGYGKCSHSGYHFFDTLSWLLEAGEGQDKSIDSVRIQVNAVRPADYLTQVAPSDYHKIFPEDASSFTSLSALKRKIRAYGEIDAFCSFAFRHKKSTITLGSVNLAHNSFSQRGWFSTVGKDLYKGNGRLRHEVHIIEQGPFQAIEFISLQSEEVRPTRTNNLFEPGGEYHLDIHVFRNHALFPGWKSHEKISIADLSTRVLRNHSRGHQEDARRNAVLEFISFLHGKRTKPVSDLSDHNRSVTLLAGVYQSLANQFVGKNPIVNMPFKK